MAGSPLTIHCWYSSLLPRRAVANFLSDEHYRRSSDCSFFFFAQPPGKKGKGSRAKKPRVSKASSRLSTQSIGTVTSEAPDLMDDSMDQSIMSQANTKSKSTRKTSKSKSKVAKNKKEEPADIESQVEADVEEVIQPEPTKPKRAGRGKKRASEDIKDEPASIAIDEKEPSQLPVEPPAKRRATKTRSSSIARNYDYEPSDSAMADAVPAEDTASEEETKRGRKLTKKRASKARKVSDVSVASKSLSNVRAPRDSEIDAEIEAGLEADVPELEAEAAQPRASKKTKSSKKPKAVTKSPEETVHVQGVAAGDFEDRPVSPVEPVDDEPLALEPPVPRTKAAKGSKKKGTKKAKAEETIRAQSPEPRESSGSKSINPQDPPEHHDSFISVEIVNKEPESAPEPTEPMTKAASKKSSRKKEATSTKEKKSKKSEKKGEQTLIPERSIEEHHAELPIDEQGDEFEIADDLPDQLEMVNPPQEHSSPLLEHSPEPQSHQNTPVLPPKTTKRYSDIPHEEHLAETLTKSQGSFGAVPESRRSSKRSNQAVSPLPPHQSTPSLSPQSSDAENRPPSSRPSASRPPAQSTPKHHQFRVPLAVTTPSPSKRNANAGFGPSSHPWTPVDIDEVLFGDASDKENADLSGLFKGVKGGLTSPEKKMTVQEWIAWNAKNGEERLKRECERLVSQFEKEGGRAMQRLEAIECID